MRKNIGTFRGNMGLYRGKPKYNSDGKISNPDLVKYYDFVYGSLVISGERYFICLDVDIILPNNIFVNNARASMVEVLPETVGEFTGFNDKYGRDIFEGDIVTFYSVWFGNKNAMVKFDEKFAGWMFKYLIRKDEFETCWLSDFNDKDCFYDCIEERDDRKNYEVIGNVFDNPELIFNGV